MTPVLAQTFQGPDVAWFSLTPLLILVVGGTLMLVVAALTPHWPKGLYAFTTAAIAGATAVLSMVLWSQVSDDGPRTLVGGALALDHFALFATIAICVAVLLAALITDDHLRREGTDGPEVHAMYLLAAAGGVVMVSANDLIVLFLGLETLSIAMYILAASHHRRIESKEAGLKYFILGGFSSAFFLYGIALIYGATGSTRLAEISTVLATETTTVSGGDSMLLIGVALLLVGLGFKVSAVPFHVWTPDVYQGAPGPVTGFMAAAGKVAAFAALLRVLMTALSSRVDDWRPAIWALAVVTLVVGSVLAAVQTDLKRMLAYSSISHAGFILVGVEAAGHVGGNDPGRGMSSALLYTLLYGVLASGSFAIVGVVSRTGEQRTDVGALRGLSREKPLLAVGFTVLLLAQAGVPLTSGFIAKFGVIQAAVGENSYAVALIAMVAAVIAAFVYLRIMIAMWIAEPEPGDAEREPVTVPLATAVAVTAAVMFTLVVGVLPSWLIDASREVVALALR
jgi:NADH-quinone oxidoreductase subunit N